MDFDEVILNATKIAHRSGGFDDCAIDGDLYEGGDGSRFWRLTVISAVNKRPPSKRVNLHCFVCGGTLRCAQAGVHLPDGEPRLGEEVSNIDAEVRRGILDATHKWETDAIGNL
jgi:hypothetical protein